MRPGLTSRKARNSVPFLLRRARRTEAAMLVTGYDDRQGCGYVLRTGPHAAEPVPGTQPVRHLGVVVLATPELAAALRDALVRNPVAQLGWGGPTVPLTFDDTTLLAWLRHTLGGVLTVAGGPSADPRRRR